MMFVCVICNKYIWFWQDRYALHGYINDPPDKLYWRHTKCAWAALEENISIYQPNKEKS